MKNTHASWRYLMIPMLGMMLVTINTQAIAQWKWINSNGVPEYSDMPPPSSIPKDKILERPKEAVHVKNSDTASIEDAQKLKEAQEAKELDEKVKEEEERKKKEEEDKKKEQEEQLKKACESSRKSLATYQSGQRIRQLNSKGEWEYLDDKQIEEKRRQTQDFLNDKCSN